MTTRTRRAVLALLALSLLLVAQVASAAQIKPEPFSLNMSTSK